MVQALAWTQREPGNAAAWNELSIGYANTRQREDAHAAARRAVDLAPKNALYWRNLGDLNLDRDAPVEALLAFEEATSWNTRDGYSFVQTGDPEYATGSPAGSEGRVHESIGAESERHECAVWCGDDCAKIDAIRRMQAPNRRRQPMALVATWSSGRARP